jgi:hypothetical protein
MAIPNGNTKWQYQMTIPAIPQIHYRNHTICLPVMEETFIVES